MNAGTLAKTPHFVLHAAVSARACAGDAPAAPEVPALRGTGPWLGALVPKRWARHAVTRNLIRRQVYAVGARQAAAWEAVGRVAVDLGREAARAVVEPVEALVRRSLGPGS